MSSSVGPDRFDRYFGSQAVLRVAGGRLDVTVPSKFMADFIDRRFGQALRLAAREVLAAEDHGQALSFKVDSSAFEQQGEPGERTEHPPSGGPAAPAPNGTGRRAISLAKPRPAAEQARYTLESFLVGSSNRMAFEAARRVADEQGPAGLHRVFIQGPCGVGKTHLLRAIAERFRQTHPHARVRYVTGEEFTNRFIAAVRSGGIEAFRHSCRHVDLLCLDDAHFLAGKDKTQTELLHTFDALDLDGARIALASDEHPRDIRSLSEQLVSRFLSAGVVRIEPPEPELRERIVRAIAAQRGLRIDDGAAKALANPPAARTSGGHVSVRDLEGSLSQAEAVARVISSNGSSGTITLGVARRVTGEDQAVAARSSRPVPFPLVISEVCRELGVTHEDFCGRGRHKRVVMARALSAFIGRQVTTLSFPEMARVMGRPTHSTLIMACTRVKRRMAADASLGEELGPEYQHVTLRQLTERLHGVVVETAGRA